jgi:hypothetical protein
MSLFCLEIEKIKKYFEYIFVYFRNDLYLCSSNSDTSVPPLSKKWN